MTSDHCPACARSWRVPFYMLEPGVCGVCDEAFEVAGDDCDARLEHFDAPPVTAPADDLDRRQLDLFGAESTGDSGQSDVEEP